MVTCAVRVIGKLLGASQLVYVTFNRQSSVLVPKFIFVPFLEAKSGEIKSLNLKAIPKIMWSALNFLFPLF